jgi:hypothetical protein
MMQYWYMQRPHSSTRFIVCVYYQGGYTPLYTASVKGHMEVIKYLAEAGADIDAKDKCKYVCIHWKLVMMRYWYMQN